MSFRWRNHSAPTKRGFFARRTGELPPHIPRAVKHFQLEAPTCGFCSQRSVTRCEYPECDVPVCARCRVRKGGGNLCRRHKHARLVQELGVPMIADTAVMALPSKRFKAKGPAVPSARPIRSL